MDEDQKKNGKLKGPAPITGYEPELPGEMTGSEPMLGGDRRLWPSIAAHLLEDQQSALRAGDRPRVMALRNLRYRIFLETDPRAKGWENVKPEDVAVTKQAIIAAMEKELEEVRAIYDFARAHRRHDVADEQSARAEVIREYVAFWRGRLETAAESDEGR